MMFFDPPGNWLISPFIWLSHSSSNAFFRQMTKRTFFTCCIFFFSIFYYMPINSQDIYDLLYTLSYLSTRKMLQNWDPKIFLNKNLSWSFWVRSYYSNSDVCKTPHSASQWWWCYLLLCFIFSKTPKMCFHNSRRLWLSSSTG